jgi:flagellar biosynthesis/type III secretory pathway protein FliH
MRDFVRQHTWPNLENAVTTTAEKLKAEGRREGFVQGQQEGLMQAHQALVRALLKQMRAKFPELSVDVERKVEMASIAQLELWLERILTAQRPEDVVTDS